MKRGFSATSIDDVARHLGATKGMIYHYYRSKTDLFFDVHQRGMAINFAAIEPYLVTHGTALERLHKMSFAHALTIMEEQAFHRTVGQGVQMHQTGSTTAEQRETLSGLIDLRDQFELLFSHAIEQAGDEADIEIGNLSFTVKSYLAVLNSPVFWYSERDTDSHQNQQEIAEELVAFALRGIGIKMEKTND